MSFKLRVATQSRRINVRDKNIIIGMNYYQLQYKIRCLSFNCHLENNALVKSYSSIHATLLKGGLKIVILSGSFIKFI